MTTVSLDMRTYSIGLTLTLNLMNTQLSAECMNIHVQSVEKSNDIPSTAPTACVGNVDRRCSDHPSDVRPRPWNLPGWIATCRCGCMFNELCALRLCVSCARFVTPFQLPHSRRWWSHSSTPDWTTAIVCLLVSQLTSYGDYSLFLTRQHGCGCVK